MFHWPMIFNYLERSIGQGLFCATKCEVYKKILRSRGLRKQRTFHSYSGIHGNHSGGKGCTTYFNRVPLLSHKTLIWLN